MTSNAGALPLALLWGFPLILSLAMLVPAAADGAAWLSLLAHPQLWPALGLSLFTGAAAALLALALSLLLLAGLHGSAGWRWLAVGSAAGLALPHLAFAIGFGFLVMPSGLLARLIAGGDAPPGWVSVQDPLGLSLTATLALKEVPFLVTAALGALARGDRTRRVFLQPAVSGAVGRACGGTGSHLRRDLRCLRADCARAGDGGVFALGQPQLWRDPPGNGQTLRAV